MRIIILIFLLGLSSSIKAGLLHFRPLTAKQVYDMLRAARREDAVPEGRVITQGIAAMSGFAAGITAGIGIPLVFNIDLANVTGITQMLYGNGGSNTQTQTQTQEICFNSKAANEMENSESGRSLKNRYSRVREGRAQRDANVEDNEYDDDNEVENDNNDDENQYSQLPTSTGDENLNRDYDENSRDYVNTPTSNDNTEKLIQVSPTTTAQTTGTTSPGETNTNTDTNTGTTSNTGTGTGTNTETTTQTGGNNAVNCIVIQKPTSG